MRKISKKDYEIEFHPDIDPIIAFAIAISFLKILIQNINILFKKRIHFF